MTDWGIIARAVHVVAVVVWIGGVGFVTAILLPGMKEKPAQQWMREFDAIEHRFAPHARIAVLLVLLSGLYMLYRYDLWDRFAEGGYWWMHLTVIAGEPGRPPFVRLMLWFRPRPRAGGKEQAQEVPMALARYQILIGGKWQDAASGEEFESFNPYTGEAWALIPRCGETDVARAVAAAQAAFDSGPWPQMTATQRGALLRRLGDLVAANAEALARTEVRDNGKLIAEMLGQTRYIPQWYYYYGGLADKIEGGVIPIDKAGVFNYTRWEPLGVVAAIVPWNSPLLLLSWKLAPALAAGNTVVVKPSEFTSASALEFGRLIEEAGFPPGVVNVVTGFGREVGEPLVTHPQVAKVAFTGGEMSGQRVHESAARGLKRVTLELGGKSPNIVFDDAALDDAVKGAISGIFAATGQTCIAGSRLLVQRSIHNEFVDKLVAFAKTARMGDPSDPDTQVGPVTTPPQYRKILDYIAIGKSEGAKVVLGGGPADKSRFGEGWFVEPTIFTGVDNTMRIAQEEIFGPVLSIIPFADEEEAVRIANDTIYGLAAGVWTQSIRRAILMAERLRAGTVWVNTYRAVSFLSPFGGYKRSGLGRENGRDAIYEYLQQKSVWISTAAEVPNPFVMR